MTVQYSKRVRSTSAGSPEGLREFRGKESKESSNRKHSPLSPRDCDDTSRDIGSFEDSSEGKEIDLSSKSGFLDIIKEGCIQGNDNTEDPRDEILIVINGAQSSSDDVQVEKVEEPRPVEESKEEQPSFDHPFEGKAPKKSPSNILRKLKTFSERFSRSTTIDLGTSRGPTDHSIIIPASPASLKSHKVNDSASIECERRAMTLPKASRKKTQTKKDKGWKILLRTKPLVTQVNDSTVNNTCVAAEAGSSKRFANGLTPPEESAGK